MIVWVDALENTNQLIKLIIDLILIDWLSVFWRVIEAYIEVWSTSLESLINQSKLFWIVKYKTWSKGSFLMFGQEAGKMYI